MVVLYCSEEDIHLYNVQRHIEASWVLLGAGPNAIGSWWKVDPKLMGPAAAT